MIKTMTTSKGGRRSLGRRYPFTIKPLEPLAERIKLEAAERQMTYQDYLVSIVADFHGMPEYAPQRVNSLREVHVVT